MLLLPWWGFDLLIFCILAAVGAALFEGMHRKWWKRGFRYVLCGALLCCIWMLVFWGSFIEPRLMTVHEEEVVLTEHPTESLTMLVVADYHVGPYKKERWVEFVGTKIAEQEYDLIVIPGDFISNGVEELSLLAPLDQLEAPQGVYAVSGNHDYTNGAAPEVISFLRAQGITVLEDDYELIGSSDHPLALAGVSDLWFEGNVKKTLRAIPNDVPVVLLSHNPDAVLLDEEDKADLVISGHTHGGQIRLPFLGPVPPLPTQLGRAYDKGLFQVGGQQLFITSGVGETGPRARLFNPPEIVKLRVRY